jgi:hypothetical protein
VTALFDRCSCGGSVSLLCVRLRLTGVSLVLQGVDISTVLKLSVLPCSHLGLLCERRLLNECIASPIGMYHTRSVKQPAWCYEQAHRSW